MSTTLNTKHPIYSRFFHYQQHHPPSTYEQHACAIMECAYKSKMFMCLASLESKVTYSVLCNTLTFKSNRWGRSRFNFNILFRCSPAKNKTISVVIYLWNIMTSFLKCLVKNKNWLIILLICLKKENKK